MAEELRTLKKKRSQIKASATRFQTFLNSLRDNSANTDQLKLRKSKFEATWSQFSDTQSELELLDDSELATNEREDFEATYFNLICIADQFISESEASVSTPSNSSFQPNSETCRIRLPKIDLPKFAGSYENWYNFYDTFNTLIHSNTSISKIEKFNYLKSSLESEAAEVLHSLEITNENYESAWNLLRNRYDNKRIIIQKHIKAIHDLPSIVKESYSGLRQLHDGFLKHFRALTSLKRPTDQWDDLLIYIINSKLDSITNKEWESSLLKNTIPTINDMTEFLARRCQILDAITKTEKLHLVVNNKPQHGKRIMSSNITTSSSSCTFCTGDHLIYHCQKFLNLTIDQRINQARTKNLCLNCLKSNHVASKCKSSSCRKCNKRHNSLLHLEPAETNTSSTTITNISCHLNNQNHVLLSTAIINVYDASGNVHECRALLDSGSQSSIISEKLVEKLGLKKNSVQISIAGINKSIAKVNSAVQIKIKSKYNAFRSNIQCLVMNRITSNLPLYSFDKALIHIPKNIKLADPNFNLTSNIDMLIGADTFWQLLCVGQIKSSVNQPYFQKTHLGWIVSGSIPANNNRYLHSTICTLSTIEDELNSSLAQFWQLEEYVPNAVYSPEEKECEQVFKTTFKRNSDGRFVVRLPIKEDVLQKIGDSRNLALKRFYALERKLNKQPELKREYATFLKEYESLGHMKLSPEIEKCGNIPTFYLPHHAVLKQTSLTTKLRVVFDGSAKSTSGTSLNDALMNGPVLQQDLLSIVLRFRSHRFVITADIAKMYRQILVDEEHTQLQRILWRNYENETVRSYDLTTVTYGTTSASFLAIRALHQLAIEEKDDHPIGSATVLRDFYVDDLLTGANTISEVETIRDEATAMLSKGGFELRKFVSNCPELVPNTSNNTEHFTINLNKNETIKTLGLQWNSHTDVLQFSVPTYTNASRITKRTILSNISQIFDPLGLLGPVIVVAKLLMQRLWQLKLAWDESVPIDIHSKWFLLQHQLQDLNSCTIPRWLNGTRSQLRCELHGFCDASELAYGACIYMRVLHSEGYSIRLVCAKSRVAPLNNISLPKLELCGALLLARLMKKTREAINVPIDQAYYWTDSTIALTWISSTARTWKTFVANRTSEIQELTIPSHWHHVNTLDNPADIISRGRTPTQLVCCTLWWNGPSWLNYDADKWPKASFASKSSDDIPERRTTVIAMTTTSTDNNFISKYSNLNKLIRIMAYCLRFKYNITQGLSNSISDKRLGPLTVNELSQANIRIIKHIQEASFKQDLRELTNHHRVHQKSHLLCLNPFLDAQGIIRVGGRLRNSSLAFAQKHQIILPKGHHFTKLLITQEHVNQLHAGAQATLAAVRIQYWPMGARNTIKQVIGKCIACFKAKPIAMDHIMGDLPASRTTPARPFTNCGVDYFGPLHVREGKRRNSRIVKMYGAIFICFATKAVHLELVTDLSTDVFIGALKRFMARRGKPSNIYSDNGTNFVGANRELREFYELFTAQSSRNAIITTMAADNITWHFIPPKSPHFGGIWEAAVKSTKHHIRRIAGNASLNYEEFHTLLVQIEAVLNSRPLTPLSNDPNDFSCLTPSHFLIGDVITSTQDPNLLPVALNRLSRWQHVERLRQHFWARWSKEYLAQNQERSRWKKMASHSIELGQLVLIREDNIPPLQWLMGRIQEVHPGKDGVTRTATVRTSRGSYKRAVVKLCPVPIDNN